MRGQGCAGKDARARVKGEMSDARTRERQGGDEVAERALAAAGCCGPGSEAGGPGMSAGRFWGWMAVALGAVAVGKGIRRPNAWAYTQAQLDYSFGFIRSGFFGATLGHALGLNRYAHFAAFSTGLLLLLFAALALLARSSKLAELTPPGELLAVYASSYSVTYLAHVNGYFDIPLALLCVGALFVRSTGRRLAAAAVATTVGILIHEQFLFAFVPVLAVSVAFGAATAKSAGERRVAWIGGALLVVLGLGLTVCVDRDGAVGAAQAEGLQQTIEQRTDGPLKAEVWQVLPLTPGENLETMRSVWRRPTFVPAQVESLLLFAPTAAVLSWATLLLLRRWMPGRHRWLYAGALLATLAPLSLNLLGWDKNRWNELLCLNAFLMLLAVARQMGGAGVQLPVRLRRACLIVMLLNMAAGGGMLDGRHIRPFPFMRSGDAAVVDAPAAGVAAQLRDAASRAGHDFVEASARRGGSEFPMGLCVVRRRL